jgi:hypothetical protein
MFAIKNRVAFVLRALADRLEPPAVLVAEPDPEPGAATLYARKFCDDLVLRDALYRSLRRYSPTEIPGQA